MYEIKEIKNKIIKKALLKLGEPFYDDDMSEDNSFKTADFLLNGVWNNILSLDDFYFNEVKEELSLSTTSQTKEDNLYIYNKPNGYLTYIQSNYIIKEIGDKFYCNKPNLEIIYKKKMDLTEIPVQAENYVILKLALELAPPLNKTELIKKLAIESENERHKLQNLNTPIFTNPYSQYEADQGEW